MNASTSSMSSRVIRGIVFGVFDGFHEGQRFFLETAAKQCDELIVVVTLSDTARNLKGKLPKHTFEERCSAIASVNQKYAVVPGDRIVGEWEIFKKYPSDVVFLGYDQQAIADEMKALGIHHVFVGSHHPEKYKSSVISYKP